MPLVPFVANKMGIPVNDDVIQDGYIGLWKAANRYDAERDIQFSTYAAAAVRNSIIRAWRRSSKSIQTDISLNQPAYRENEGDAPELLEIIGDKKSELPFQYRIFEIFLDSTLTEEERKIIYMRANGDTFRRIGKACGRSDTWVIDRLRRIREKVNRHYGKEG